MQTKKPDWWKRYQEAIGECPNPDTCADCQAIIAFISQVEQEAEEREKQKWIKAIEGAECDDFELRAKDHNKKIFEKYQQSQNL